MFGSVSSGKGYKRKINKRTSLFFFTAKQTINKTKEQFFKWEKIFAMK